MMTIRLLKPLKDPKGLRVLWGLAGLLERTEQMGRLVLRVLLERTEQMALTEVQGKMVVPARTALMESTVSQAQLEPMELPDLKARKALLDPLVPLAPLEPMDRMVETA